MSLRPFGAAVTEIKGGVAAIPLAAGQSYSSGVGISDGLIPHASAARTPICSNILSLIQINDIDAWSRKR
jgi:hypothetical protein